MSNLCIWIIGGSGVGKTTLAASIHSMLAEMTKTALKPQIIGWGDREKEFVFTRMSPCSANLGTFGKTACGGTDSLSTKDRISKSYLQAIQFSPIVVIEGIMATATWHDWIKENPKTKLFLIHLEISPEENFKRLKTRRAKKQNIKVEDVILQPKTLDNLRSKLTNFRNLYRKIAPKSDYHLQIHCDVLSKERSIQVVKEYMIDHILS